MTRIPVGQCFGPGMRYPVLGDRGRHPGGEFGDLRTLPRLTVTVECGAPSLFGDRLDRCLDGVLGMEPDRVLQPQVGDPVQEHLRAGAGIGTNQHLPPLVLGELDERGVQGGEVIGAVPWRGLPGPQVDRKRFPGSVLTMVDERAHRREPVAALEGRLGAFLVRVRGHQRGVNVHDHLTTTTTSWGAAQWPATGPQITQAIMLVTGP
jgi:hypothetical protein